MDVAEYKTVAQGVSAYFKNKFERETARNWDRFYVRNRANFFRDRHWTTRGETDGFPCLFEPSEESPIVLIESGCGAGNCAFPLLGANPSFSVYMFDFAPQAVELVKSSEPYDEKRCHAFVWDFASGNSPPEPLPPPAHFALVVFVLSAIPPVKQQTAVNALAKLLKPGGKLLFRDYATGDMAQKRFAKSSTIASNYFVRQDSTLSFFFDEDHLHQLMEGAGLTKIYVRRVHRTITNRKEKIEMERVFLQAEYFKSE